MFDSPYAQVKYDERIDVVICRWKTDVTKEEYQKAMLEGMKLLQDTKSKNWVSDYLDEVTELPSDPEWFVHVFLPLTVHAAVENIFFITSKESTIKDDVLEVSEKFKEFFNVKAFDSIEEVYKEL